MSSTSGLLIAYLSTGFAIGFGHCIGMCGPLVVSLTLSLNGRPLLVPQLLYHGGRTLTYMVLGGLMAATGSFTMVAAHITVLQKGALFLTGGMIVCMGLAMTGWVPLGKIFGLNYSPGGLIAKKIAHLSQSATTAAYFPIGLLLGLLPCGPVYTALLGAARAGMEAPHIGAGIVAGMALMAAFGLGTIPALFLVAKLVDLGWLKARAKIYQLGALVMIGVGIYFIVAAWRY